MSFNGEIQLNLNDLTEGANSVPGENQFGFRDIWNGLFGDLKTLSEEINDASANAETLIDWRKGF